MTRPLMSPDGCRIVGTLETLSAVARVIPDSLRRNAEGEIEYDFEGGSDVDWDSSTTVERDGQVIFVDEDGTEWAESELVEIPEEDDDGDEEEND